MELFGNSEATVRLAVFIGVLLTLVVSEWLWPRRALAVGRRRWPTNLTIVVLGAALVRLLAVLSPILLAVGAAQWAARNGWGLFNTFEGYQGLKFAAALLALDALVWAQHVAFHRVHFFWRFHRMHHADRDFDVTTALRFHPGEILASMLIKVVAVLLLGPSATAVVVFEIALNGCAMFNHANLRLPRSADRLLRKLIVTPDMHRVHHSVHAAEHQKNFGFCLSVWDHLFGSYLAQPRDGHTAMTIGLSEYATDAPTQLAWCLTLPAAPLHAAHASRPKPQA